MTVLIFRPPEKIRPTCSAFIQAGIDAVGIALIESRPENRALAAFVDRLKNLQNGTILIFISTTAARLVKEKVDRLPPQIQCFAIGQSTANGLVNASADVKYPDIETTEGILAMPAFENIAGLPVIIVKGEGGRTTLKEGLTARGAVVTEANVYRRVRISRPNATEDWNASDIKCIIATSGEIIEAAFEQFDKDWLKQTRWIVVSKRTKAVAQRLGVTDIAISHGAQTQKLIAATKHFLEQ